MFLCYFRSLPTRLFCRNGIMWCTDILPGSCDWSIFGIRWNDSCCSTVSYSEGQVSFYNHWCMISLNKKSFPLQYQPWEITSILGVGIATMALVFFLDIYYCVIIAWTFFYFIAAFTAIPDLPWNTCGEYSSMLNCYNQSIITSLSKSC